LNVHAFVSEQHLEHLGRTPVAAACDAQRPTLWATSVGPRIKIVKVELTRGFLRYLRRLAAALHLVGQGWTTSYSVRRSSDNILKDHIDVQLPPR